MSVMEDTLIVPLQATEPADFPHLVRQPCRKCFEVHLELAAIRRELAELRQQAI